MFRKYLGLFVVFCLVGSYSVKAKSMFEESFERDQRRYKSEMSALSGSLLAATVPSVVGFKVADGGSESAGLALVVGGIVLGPSVGHFYAGQNRRGILGVAIRGGILAGATGIGCFLEKDASLDSEGFALAYALIAGGLVSSLHGVYDICAAPSSARKYNESLPKEKTVKLVPEIDLINENYGVSVVYNF